MNALIVLDIPVDPNSDVFIIVGQKIKGKRLEKKMKQQQLAAAIDIEKTNLSRIEAGRTNPTLWTLLKISHALEMPVSELLNGITL